MVLLVDMTEKRTSEPEDVSIESLTIEEQREQTENSRISKDYATTKKV